MRLLAIFAFLALLSSPGSARPNFIFFITDDISPSDTGPYGNRSVKTPNLDRMAGQGLVFEEAWLTTSSCSPSRCSIITGRYPHNTGAPELHVPLPKDQHTFVQSLREAGYHTILSGKNHMAPPEQLGFEEVSDSEPAGSENWVKHLRERPKDKPFFAWFASHDAHYPFQMDDEAPSYDPQQIEVPPMLADGPRTREELAKFYHEVSRTDTYLGKLMDELARQGIADETYLIYCSDNGRPFPRCKTYLYESGLRTPLLVTGPRVATGRTNSIVSSIDFSATILELAEVEKPDSIQGVSFARVLENPSAQSRSVAFAERNWHVYQNHARAVRQGHYLYLWNAWPDRPNLSGESSIYADFPAAEELWQAASAGKLTPAQALLTKARQPEEMLFDLRSDPHQFHNLAGDPAHAKALESMRTLLESWKSRTGDSVPKNPTPDRQPFHGKAQHEGFRRGDMAGADRGASSIHDPGPVMNIEPR